MSVLRVAIVSLLVLTMRPAVALAGMPHIELTDVARLRLQGISFFLAGLLLATVSIRFLWNRLQGDFTFLPRLTFGKALGVVVLWGLLFVLVLAMISGARELMTPGAWEKVGTTYRLKPSAEPSPPATDEDDDSLRRQKLDQLRFALWDYARSHDGNFPPNRDDAGVAADAWKSADPSGLRFVYLPGRKAGESTLPVVYEPQLYGKRRLALFSNGTIRHAGAEELAGVRR